MPITRDPYHVYVGGLPRQTSRRTMGGCLDRVARLILGADSDDPTVTGAGKAWWTLDYEATSALRSAMIATEAAPATINKTLSGIRQVLKASWRLGYMDSDAYHRAADIASVQGTRLPAGRAVSQEEFDQLLAACDDGTVRGARDGAAVALLYVTGCRREELADAVMASLNMGDWALRVLGKGNKERLVPVAPAARPWVLAWLRVRGTGPGGLLCPTRAGKVCRDSGTGRLAGVSAQTLADLLAHRGMIGGVPHVTPHDFRRTVTGDLLDFGVDLVSVSKVLGHARTETTQKYDRRRFGVLAEAVAHLRLPPPRRAATLPHDEAPDGG